MTFRATAWAFRLREVSPLAKLLAIYSSDFFQEDAECPAAPIVLSKAAEFCGAGISDIKDALRELEAVGVTWENDKGTVILYLPVEIPAVGGRSVHDRSLCSIYVI